MDNIKTRNINSIYIFIFISYFSATYLSGGIAVAFQNEQFNATGLSNEFIGLISTTNGVVEIVTGLFILMLGLSRCKISKILLTLSPILILSMSLFLSAVLVTSSVNSVILFIVSAGIYGIYQMLTFAIQSIFIVSSTQDTLQCNELNQYLCAIGGTISSYLLLVIVFESIQTVNDWSIVITQPWLIVGVIVQLLVIVPLCFIVEPLPIDSNKCLCKRQKDKITRQDTLIPMMISISDFITSLAQGALIFTPLFFFSIGASLASYLLYSLVQQIVQFICVWVIKALDFSDRMLVLAFVLVRILSTFFLLAFALLENNINLSYTLLGCVSTLYNISYPMEYALIGIYNPITEINLWQVIQKITYISYLVSGVIFGLLINPIGYKNMFLVGFGISLVGNCVSLSLFSFDYRHMNLVEETEGLMH